MILDAIVGRSLRDRWRSLVAWQVGLLALVTVQMAVYPTVRDTSTDWEGAVESFPEALREILRLEDYTSPTGYLSTELLSFVVPFIFMTLGATWGARVTAEEEEGGTADITWTLPITRREYLASRWTTGIVVLVMTALVFTSALWIGNLLLDMKISIGHFGNVALMLFLTGLTSFALAGTVGTSTGRRSVGLGVAMVVLITGFVFYSLAPLVDFFASINPYNPLQWMLGARPLTSGVSIGYVALLMTLSAVGFASSDEAFRGRDIRV